MDRDVALAISNLKKKLNASEQKMDSFFTKQIKDLNNQVDELAAIVCAYSKDNSSLKTDKVIKVWGEQIKKGNLDIKDCPKDFEEDVTLYLQNTMEKSDYNRLMGIEEPKPDDY